MHITGETVKCILGKWQGYNSPFRTSCLINVKTSAVENGALKRIPEGYTSSGLFTPVPHNNAKAGKSPDYAYIWEKQTRPMIRSD